VNEYSPKTWEIEHQCPQCGAPITLGETERLFSCSYCRTRYYLIPRDYFKYYLPPSDHSSKDLVFIPYWRLRGMVFFCKADDLGHRVIDVSSLAVRRPWLPPSLGFRPQVLKLKFVSSEMVGRFFKPDIPLETVIQNIGMHLHPLNGSASAGPSAFRAFIGETTSLIYAPLFIDKDTAHDAILMKPLAPIPKDFADGLLPFDQQGHWQIEFVSTLCPRCGWDLLGEKDSVVLFCKNCNSAWEASPIGLKEVNFGMFPIKANDVLYLPFWRMKVLIEGPKIQSHTDLTRVANVPKVTREEGEGSDLYFWSPAFKVPPEVFLRLTQGMTASRLREEREGSLPWASLYPVTLPVTEAAESIKITIASCALDKEMILPRLDEMKIHLNESLLVYLPFTSSGIDFVEPHTHLCIHKNYLKLGRNF